jgi:hypothetical protein
MARSKIKVNTNAVASQYAFADEKIIEFSSPNGGGLMAFTLQKDGTLLISVYRQDATVHVAEGRPEEDGTPLPENRIMRGPDGEVTAYVSKGYHLDEAGQVVQD